MTDNPTEHPTNNPWGPIRPERWSDVPAIRNRPATEWDVHGGIAVFYGESEKREALPLTLPQPAFHVDAETGNRTPVVVIQAESTRDQYIVGVRYLDGGSGVCLLDELMFVDESAMAQWMTSANPDDAVDQP
jgi:hypothetical protein